MIPPFSKGLIMAKGLTVISEENREKDLFLEALELAPQERESFLDGVCAGDASLKTRVLDLLQSSLGLLQESGAEANEEDLGGSMIAHYRVGAKIGKGGMGEVYRATDSRLSREVAIKVLPASLLDDVDVLARFEREARVLAALNHRNIATIYGIEQVEDSKAIVMELVEGETLEQRLRCSSLETEEAVSIFQQIARGLGVAHGKGIVHRDLKPGNIKFTTDDQVKILDFGLAKEDPETLPPDGGETTTLPGMVLGTPSYMSPEQARGLAVDHRTDIWAFGCCLFEALVGHPPFRGETSSDVLAEVLKVEPDFMPLVATGAEALQPLLRGCLVKNPEDRWDDLGIIADELNHPTPAPRDSRGRISRSKQRSRLMLCMFGASLLLVAIGVWHTVSQQDVGPTDDEEAGDPSALKFATPDRAPLGMAYIPGGEFTMGLQGTPGSDATFPEREKPVRPVRIDPLYMERYEVTAALWEQIRRWSSQQGYDIPLGKSIGDQHPIHSVSWFSAIKWCNARSEMEGLVPAYYHDFDHRKVLRTGEVGLGGGQVKWDANGYRLPTEAEWERAARGGRVGDLFPWGSTISPGDANYFESGDPFEKKGISNKIGRTTPVGYYDGNQEPKGPDRSNGYGLYDMAGNVYEWCFDLFNGEYYKQGPFDNPRGPDFNSHPRRSVRGGSWHNSASNIRCAFRTHLLPRGKSPTTGFRCVRSW